MHMGLLKHETAKIRQKCQKIVDRYSQRLATLTFGSTGICLTDVDHPVFRIREGFLHVFGVQFIKREIERANTFHGPRIWFIQIK